MPKQLRCPVLPHSKVLTSVLAAIVELSQSLALGASFSEQHPAQRRAACSSSEAQSQELEIAMWEWRASWQGQACLVCNEELQVQSLRLPGICALALLHARMAVAESRPV